MPRKFVDHIMVEECKRKRISPNGFRLPDPIRDGEVLTDIKDKKWRLGKAIGLGGFGEIYLASEEINKPVTQDAKCIAKIEPHTNGPLFVEMNFYIRAAQREMITSWMQKKKLSFLGMPCYIASGSHVYESEKYRFLIIERYGKDLSKIFVESKKKFHLQTVLHLGIQVLNILEYVHSMDYIHADIKGSNLLMGSEPGRVYLVDFGLACRYRSPNGHHKEYHPDERRAHDGTIEYTSRDAHIGAHSRRGDLEVLGYNMLQWLCSELPWEDNLADMEYVHMQKKVFMSNIPSLMRRCFPDTCPPDVIEKYFRYVASLGFETQPDYGYCRDLLRQGMRCETYDNNGKLLFGLKPVKVASKSKKSVKRKANNEPENQGEIKKRIVFRNTVRKPCVPQNYNRMTRNSNPTPVLRSRQFSWEKVLSGDPEVLLKKKSGFLGRKNQNNGFQLPHQERQIVRDELNVIDEFQEDSVNSTDFSTLGIPTPAMLEVMERRKTVLGQTGKKWRLDSLTLDTSEILTPAMEDVIRRRKNTSSDLADSAVELQYEDDSEEENSCGQNSVNGRKKTLLRMNLRKKRPINMCEWDSSSSSSCSNISSCYFPSYEPGSDYSSVSSFSSISMKSYSSERSSVVSPIKNQKVNKKSQKKVTTVRTLSSRLVYKNKGYNLRQCTERSNV